MDIDSVPNDPTSKEVLRLWRAWRTVHEMVADRVSRDSSRCGEMAWLSRL